MTIVRSLDTHLLQSPIHLRLPIRHVTQSLPLDTNAPTCTGRENDYHTLIHYRLYPFDIFLLPVTQNSLRSKVAFCYGGDVDDFDPSD